MGNLQSFTGNGKIALKDLNLLHKRLKKKQFEWIQGRSLVILDKNPTEARKRKAFKLLNSFCQEKQLIHKSEWPKKTAPTLPLTRSKTLPRLTPLNCIHPTKSWQDPKVIASVNMLIYDEKFKNLIMNVTMEVLSYRVTNGVMLQDARVYQVLIV